MTKEQGSLPIPEEELSLAQRGILASGQKPSSLKPAVRSPHGPSDSLPTCPAAGAQTSTIDRGGRAELQKGMGLVQPSRDWAG